MLPGCNSLQEAIEVIRRSPIANLRSEAWMDHELLPYPEIMRDHKRVDYGIGLAEANPVSL